MTTKKLDKYCASLLMSLALLVGVVGVGYGAISAFNSMEQEYRVDQAENTAFLESFEGLSERDKFDIVRVKNQYVVLLLDEGVYQIERRGYGRVKDLGTATSMEAVKQIIADDVRALFPKIFKKQKEVKNLWGPRE